MAITYITGDLLQHAKTGIIAHIVNDQGGWGKGFSGQLSKMYPRAEHSYRNWFKSGYFYCGLTHIEALTNNLLVAHMAAQMGYKGKGNPKPLDYDALRDCLSSLTRTDAATRSLPIHMPRIGSGLGGGDWNDIEAIINEEAPDLDIRVYTLRKEAPMAINFRSPRDEFGLLHNFANCPMYYRVTKFPTSEHAYQAAKFPITHPAVEEIAKARTPKEAKELAYSHKEEWDTPEWHERKLIVMQHICREKFAQNKSVRDLLAKTAGHDIIETSAFDKFWGKVGGVGQNWLGRIWEKIRTDELGILPLSGITFEIPTTAPVVPQVAPTKPLVRQKPFCTIESPTKGRRDYWDLDAAYTAIRRAKEAGFYTIIAASGSRERDTQEDYTAFETRVQRLCKLRDEDLQHIAIVQGGARGFDRVARDYAYANKLPLITFHADWDGPDQRQAGIVRNQYIINVADELIAAPSDSGTGTQDAMRKARLSKVPVTTC